MPFHGIFWTETMADSKTKSNF